MLEYYVRLLRALVDQVSKRLRILYRTLRRYINAVLLVHGQVTIIFVVSVCLSVCLCRVFLSRLRSDLDQTRTHVTRPGLVVSPRI